MWENLSRREVSGIGNIRKDFCCIEKISTPKIKKGVEL
jgi:hypothetical protein